MSVAVRNSSVAACSLQKEGKTSPRICTVLTKCLYICAMSGVYETVQALPCRTLFYLLVCKYTCMFVHVCKCVRMYQQMPGSILQQELHFCPDTQATAAPSLQEGCGMGIGGVGTGKALSASISLLLGRATVS